MSRVPQISPAHFKTKLKMAVSKLRFIQEKKTALSKILRRQLADLLRAGKELSARIRVENIIREDISVELLEFCELYCELLLARVLRLLEPQATLDPGLLEAVLLIMYACQHTEVREVVALADVLRAKYGDLGEEHVPEKITRRCGGEPPLETLVEMYLVEIARAYSVPYGDVEVGQEPAEAEPEAAETGNSAPSDFDALRARFAALKR